MQLLCFCLIQRGRSFREKALRRGEALGRKTSSVQQPCFAEKREREPPGTETGTDLGALVFGFCVKPAADHAACFICFIRECFEVFGEARAAA